MEKNKLIYMLNQARKIFLRKPKEHLYNDSGICWFLSCAFSSKDGSWFFENAQNIKPSNPSNPSNIENPTYWFCDMQKQRSAYIKKVKGYKTARSYYCKKLIERIEQMDESELKLHKITSGEPK